MSIDVAEFERQTRSGLSKPIEQLTEADHSALRASIGLYRGNVLSGFSGLWALRERERLRSTYLNAAERLMHFSELHREYDDAIHYARLVLAVDELREDVHRDLMRYLVCNGQRALALRQFEVCRTALHRELAIRPMQETMAVYRQIAESATAASKPEQPHQLPSPPAGRGAIEGSMAPNRPALPPAPERPVSAESTWPVTAAGEVRAARHLLAEADNRLKKTLRLIQH